MSAIGQDACSNASRPRTRTSPGPTVTRGHSCLLCQQRKVRCNGQRPCSTCVKTNAQCISKASSTSGPRSTKVMKRSDDTLSRLKRAEKLLNQHGLDLDTREPLEISVMGGGERPDRATADPDTGKLVPEGCHSRYIENAVWDGLNEELPGSPHDPEEPPDTVSTSASTPTFLSESLILGGSASASLSSMHPDPVRIFRLWHTFLENVNPLIKLLHVPTVQGLLLEASADLSAIAPSMEALMFMIYLSALTSLTEKECQKIMGESGKVLIERFTVLAQQALVNARFMRSFDLITLQAFLLFVLSVRQRCDSQSLWMLSGLLIRSAQRLGLHREKALQGFSILEAELRRRLWWQILVHDSYAAKLCGVAFHMGSNFTWDTKLPLNVNDSDLHHDMSEPPKGHIGATEMIFCSTKLDIGAFRVMNAERLRGSLNFAVVDAELEVLSRSVEQGALRFCDRSIPLHLLASLLAKGSVCQLKLTAHLPRHYANRRTTLPQGERDMLFSLCLELIEMHNLGAKTDGIQKYSWFIDAYFPMEALIFVLGELAYHSPLSESHIKTAWGHIDKAFELRPHLLQEDNNAMHRALCSLTMRAWDTTVGKHSRRPMQSTTPQFMKMLSSKTFKSTSTTQSRQDISQHPTHLGLAISHEERTHHVDSEQSYGLNILTDFSLDDAFPWQYWPDFSGAGNASAFEQFHSGQLDQPSLDSLGY